MLKGGLLEPEVLTESTVGRVKADVAHGGGVERIGSPAQIRRVNMVTRGVVSRKCEMNAEG